LADEVISEVAELENNLPSGSKTTNPTSKQVSRENVDSFAANMECEYEEVIEGKQIQLKRRAFNTD